MDRELLWNLTMASTRSPIDRLMQLVTPRPVADFAPPPRRLATDLWALDRQLRMPGGPVLPLRTTLIRLRDGSLVVISPPPLEEAGGAAIADLGRVRHVVAPNSFHHGYAAALAARHPEADLLVAPGLPARVPTLPPARELGPQPPPAWAGELEIAILGPVRGLSEVVFFHVASGTVVLSDLAFNMTRFRRAVDRIAWRCSGVPRGFGPSRTARLLLLRDRAAAGRCLRQVAQWPMRRIVVAHGEAVEDDARARFMRAFAAYLAAPPPAP